MDGFEAGDSGHGQWLTARARGWQARGRANLRLYCRRFRRQDANARARERLKFEEETMARDFEDHVWKDLVGPDLLHIYKHYKRDTKVGPRPALLAIDLYNLVYRGGPRPVREIVDQYPSSCGIHAWNALEPTKRLFAAARRAGIPVLYTTAAIGKGKVNATNRQSGNAATEDDFAIHDAFKPEPDDIVVVKERASGFFGTPLIAHLTRLGVSSIVICGDSTSGCVRATTVDGYSHGFHCTVVEECVFDRSELSHKVNLFDMHHKYADVMGVDEVLRHLGSLGHRAAAE
jgi:nicotinamidase-related amidase